MLEHTEVKIKHNITDGKRKRIRVFIHIRNGGVREGCFSKYISFSLNVSAQLVSDITANRFGSYIEKSKKKQTHTHIHRDEHTHTPHMVTNTRNK